MTDIPALLAEIRGALEEAGVAYATIGGCARNAYAEPRATKDVDFAVSAAVTGYRALVVALAARKFVRATLVRQPGDEVPDFEAFRDTAGRRVDLLFAKTEFEQSALARATPRVVYAGVTLPVVTAEDLLVYKLLAARTQDWADAEIVVRARAIGGQGIDWEYVQRWCDEWEVGDRVAELRHRAPASQ